MKMGKILNRHQKGRIAVLFVLMLIGAFLEMLGVTLMLPVISAVMQPDIIEANDTVAWVCGMLRIHSHKMFTIVCIAALIAVFIFKDMFLVFEYYVQYRFVYNNRFFMQCRLFEVYMQKPYEYFLYAQSGEVIRVVQRDVANVFNILSTLLTLATDCIVTFVLVITVFVISPMMTSFVAGMMLLMILAIVKVLRPVMHKEGIAVQQGYASTNKWLLQAINGVKEIKVAQKEHFFLAHYEKSGRKLIHSEKVNAVSQPIPRLLIEMTSICSALAVIAILICMGQPMESLIPAFGAFAMAAVKLLPSANRIVSSVNTITYSEPALDKLLENLGELDGAAEAGKQQGSEKGLAIEKEIVLKSVSYCYPNSSSQVLKEADLAIPVGKSVGIVGVSGSGKTTTVDILLGLLAPKEGKVLADGVDVRTAYHSWLSHIGYIPQMIFMLDDSIRANVAFGYDSAQQDDGMVWKALKQAQLADFIRTLPEGLDTQIGERGIRLSGGQRQRIGIARALYTDPELLVFDEATSALDNETEAAIMESIDALHGKKTMIVIAHRLTTIETCDMVYRIDDGRIIRER